ncbi:MAG: 6-carboxytetrahydropterin synthase [Flavobacteriales bacterium]|nr:6-carboxytetrahydropterin synthase [Flavobacteriales bacterium]
MIFITRRERFSAAHKLWNQNWSDEKNFSTFGKCANPNWHGHNYELFVTVKGSIDPDTGFVADLKEIGKILNEKVISKIDHKNLNLDCEFMKDVMTSTENLAVEIWNQIKSDMVMLGCELHCVKITETENQYVEYFG